MSSCIDDILEFDAIYRSDGPGYVQFRRYYLKKSDKTLNVKFRQNTYLPLRILLLETTRSKAQYSLNNLWMLLHTRRMKTPAILSIPTDDVEPILWHKACPTLDATAPISCMHFSPTSKDIFAYSTLDGSLHFALIAEDKIKPNGRISVPSVAFLKFEWITDSLIIGLSVTTSAYILCGGTRICELILPSPPSEVLKYPNGEAIAIIGTHTGHLYCIDLTELAESASGFRQDMSSATLSKYETEITRFHNAKKQISALASVNGSETIICGTSDGDIDIVSVEAKFVKKRGKMFMELKAKSVTRISAMKYTNSPKSTSVDSLSMIILDDSDDQYVFYNTRNETAALLKMNEGAKHLQLVKNYRVPSLRAKCPCAVNNFRGKWVWVCGTDMGDLMVCDQNEDPTIVTLHESAIVSVEWVPNSHMFLAADVSGLISFWAKTETKK